MDHQSDAALLEMLTAPTPPNLKPSFARRDAALDPLLLAAAAASGPNVTRNHYHHDFFPGVMVPQAEGAWDWTRWKGEEAGMRQKKRLTYVSRQAPRSTKYPNQEKENDKLQVDPLVPTTNVDPAVSRKRRTSTISPVVEKPNVASSSSTGLLPSSGDPSIVEVKCMARTRIPTPHGTAFLHLYHNNRDKKEHLAVVIDPAQFSDSASVAPPIRSESLDAVWSENETEMDRITRGAYVGRLSAKSHSASTPHRQHPQPLSSDSIPSPLIRIHSECFTGETVGSMRCDCGEQLDEAIRLISQPITLPSATTGIASQRTIPGRGAVIYLRQEGRGIGLLSKIRAYNLQDLGHDTVTANLMLGHQADERGYEIAGAILRDLGMGQSEVGEGVRLLTNNPDKVQALEKEGLRIVERVPMVPRSWKARSASSPDAKQADLDRVTQQQKGEKERIHGATLIGGDAVHGEDLEKYLRTKVLRMGHMLPLYLGDSLEDEHQVPV